jgi:hypothetical protein
VESTRSDGACVKIDKNRNDKNKMNVSMKAMAKNSTKFANIKGISSYT